MRLVDAIFGKIDDAYPMWEETKSWASGVASEVPSVLLRMLCTHRRAPHITHVSSRPCLQTPMM
eukprot:516967-Amphidinium_carterae.1